MTDRTPQHGAMLCKHVNDQGSLSDIDLHVTGFTFIQLQTTSIGVIEWLFKEPQGQTTLYTDERGGLRMHAVFSDPNDALLFKLTFADILERV